MDSTVPLPVIDFFLSVPLDASADMVLVLVIGDIHIPHRYTVVLMSTVEWIHWRVR